MTGDGETLDSETILAARAEALARPLEGSAQRTLYVIAVLGDQRVAIVATRAQHVSAAHPVTLVPSQLDAMAGIVALHGTVVAAVDLAAVLGVPAGKAVPERDLVVVDDGGEALALLVDDVEGLAELDDASFDRPDASTLELAVPGPGGIRLLNVDAVISRISPARSSAPQPSGGHP